MQRSIAALKPHSLHIYQLHHVDEIKNLSAVLAMLQKAQSQGLIGGIGLCNCTLPQLREAMKVVKVVSVQNPYSLWDRTAEKELPAGAAASSKKGVLPFCQAHGIAFMPYGVFGGVKARDKRVDLVRDFPDVVAMAKSKGVSAHALVLAYMRARWPCILHIVGTRNPARIPDIVSAAKIELSAKEVATLDAVKPKKS